MVCGGLPRKNPGAPTIVNMKKYFLVFMLLCFITNSVEAQKQEFADNLYWELNGGVLTISGSGRLTNGVVDHGSH